jgi:L-threonylcarbamoyladenylate synthase
MILDSHPQNLEKAVRAVQRGQLVAMPTETVYGLAANALSDEAVVKIFEVKGRPRFNPLIVHVPSLQDILSFAELPSCYEHFAKAFWPGPVTLVLKRRKEASLSLLVTAGLETVAVRIPHHPEALNLLKAVGLPLAAPSANKSGKVSPTTSTHVRDAFTEQEVAYVLEGGACEIGVESTILDLSLKEPTLLRPGGLSVEEMEAFLGKKIKQPQMFSHINAPGQLESHYAPSLPVRLNALNLQEGEMLLGFGSVETDFNLSKSGNLREAAANLFKMLRQLDEVKNIKRIAVSPIPEEGLGRAINDRLRRAAAPREGLSG